MHCRAWRGRTQHGQRLQGVLGGSDPHHAHKVGAAPPHGKADLLLLAFQRPPAQRRAAAGLMTGQVNRTTDYYNHELMYNNMQHDSTYYLGLYSRVGSTGTMTVTTKQHYAAALY